MKDIAMRRSSIRIFLLSVIFCGDGHRANGFVLRQQQNSVNAVEKPVSMPAVTSASGRSRSTNSPLYSSYYPDSNQVTSSGPLAPSVSVSPYKPPPRLERPRIGNFGGFGNNNRNGRNNGARSNAGRTVGVGGVARSNGNEGYYDVNGIWRHRGQGPRRHNNNNNRQNNYRINNNNNNRQNNYRINNNGQNNNRNNSNNNFRISNYRNYNNRWSPSARRTRTRTQQEQPSGVVTSSHQRWFDVQPSALSNVYHSLLNERDSYRKYGNTAYWSPQSTDSQQRATIYANDYTDRYRNDGGLSSPFANTRPYTGRNRSYERNANNRQQMKLWSPKGNRNTVPSTSRLYGGTSSHQSNNWYEQPKWFQVDEDGYEYQPSVFERGNYGGYTNSQQRRHQGRNQWDPVGGNSRQRGEGALQQLLRGVGETLGLTRSY